MATKLTLDADITRRFLHLKDEFSEELASLLDFWSSKGMDNTHGGLCLIHIYEPTRPAPLSGMPSSA